MKHFHFQPLEDLLGEKITSSQPLAGGCTNEAYRVQFASGTKIAVKCNPTHPDVFPKEANGLQAISRAGMLTPKVIHVSADLLALEFIEEHRKTPRSGKLFGEALATMHRHAGSNFGFLEDGYIGANVQKNLPRSDAWSEFFFEQRLVFQLRLAEKLGTATSELRRKIGQLEAKIAVILQSPAEKPSLLHGDLWSGNYLVGADEQTYLIDPAVYYGHREAELALCRLFGGFPEEFFNAYEAAYPLAEGWQSREGIYQLYHLLNHLNMLGSSYYPQVIAALNNYLV